MKKKKKKECIRLEANVNIVIEEKIPKIGWIKRQILAVFFHSFFHYFVLLLSYYYHCQTLKKENGKGEGTEEERKIVR